MDVVRGGRWLKGLREDRELTQQQAADQVNRMYNQIVIHQQDIAQIERGKTSNPSFSLLCEYAAFYRKTPEEVAVAYDVQFYRRDG